MLRLFSKDETLSLSPPVVGWAIIKIMQDSKTDRISIFDLADTLKQRERFSSKAMYLGLLFLFLIGEVDVRQAYVERRRDADSTTV